MKDGQRAKTQDLIPIKNIENGIVQLNDGSLLKVILVDGTNFELKSEDALRQLAEMEVLF